MEANDVENLNQNDNNNNKNHHNQNILIGSDTTMLNHSLNLNTHDVILEGKLGAYDKTGNGQQNQLTSFFKQNVHIFPLILAFLIPTICLLNYSTAISHGHVTWIFPYVSDVGTLPPEAAVFSMMLDISAILFALSGYYRYKMVIFQLNHQLPVPVSSDTHRHYHKLNFTSLLFACLVSFGLLAVGNFRASEGLNIHLFAAGLCFLPILGLLWLHVRMGLFLYEHRVESRPISFIIFSLIYLITLVTTSAFTAMSIAQSGDKALNNEWRLNWPKNEPGYVCHLIGAVSEWIQINTVSLMLFCLFNRMKKFEHFDKI